MRRYTLAINNREFTLDVQEISADQFEVVVGDEPYLVNLTKDETLAETTIIPGLQPQAGRPIRIRNLIEAAPAKDVAPAAKPAPARTPSGNAGKGAMTAPMPGVIIEVNVKAGDTVSRGQQVAILDAMKMHNVIGASRDGVVAEVHVESGQSVNHGAAILTFEEN